MMFMHRVALALVCLALLSSLFLPVAPPDAAPDESASLQATPAGESLARVLHLQWSRDYPTLQPAWPDQTRLQFDAACKPVVDGQTLFLASSRTDGVTALDTETGAEKWKFLADGPVRFAPAVWEGRVYFVCDDGYLYCLDAAKGSLLWKFRGGPSDRKLLGNNRLISTWPARGAPALADGKVYFAAGVWPFMGTFLHALDARTGEVAWTNDGDGSLYIKQPHQAAAFAGAAPQGTLVVAGDKLLVPGRSTPACYDRKTGKLIHFRLADNSKIGGGSEVSALGSLYENGGVLFELATGQPLGASGEHAILTRDVLYCYAAGQCLAYDLRKASKTASLAIDRKGKKVKTTSFNMPRLSAVPVGPVETMIRAGARLYAGSENKILALDLPFRAGKKAISWETTIEGKPVHLAAGDQRLFVSTRAGRIYCFGPEPAQPKHYPLTTTALPVVDAWTAKAEAILGTTGVRDGYCVAWGVASGQLITELTRRSNLRLIVIDPDEDRVNDFRKKLMAAGLYGERVVVHQGDAATYPLPPYLASLMVSEDLDAAGVTIETGFLRKMFEELRPYGGVACFELPARKRSELGRLATLDPQLKQARVRHTGKLILLSREGGLPGAANWTHEHADAANTRVSKDQLVKAPLGLLWFGGPSHGGVLPRHGHGPQPQVVDGRLFIEGVNMLRAVDIYTGRLLWEASLPGVGKAYDTLPHQAGANAGGTNYISTADGIYIAHDKLCVRLDPATGKRLAEFKLPILPGEEEPPAWGYINVYEDYLIGGANPPLTDTKGKNAVVSSSKTLFVLNRHNGKVLWSVTAQSGFRHNGICLGGGRLYCLDRPSTDHLARIKRLGDVLRTKPRLLALNLKTGKEIWSTTKNVFGTWLSYSAKHDVLIESGRVARDTLWDEPKGIRAFSAAKGKVLWHQKSYIGPAMIHGETILADHGACDLLTGAAKMRQDPITGLPIEWSWTRGYGCNTPAASEHLLTFRSGAAGYFDLSNDGGTGNIGGVRSGCTNSLIVAGGLLNLPDYTRNCTCSYQNQTSLALIHMPEAEMWTYFGKRDVSGPVKRVGINFGAPGNRLADNGTLWLEYPPVGGPSPSVPVSVTPSNPEWFRHHSSRIESKVPWIGASGAKGVQSVAITLGRESDRKRTYTVRLYFVEPDRVKAGQRVFNVSLQGKEVLANLDIVKEAGGPNRTLVKEFKGVQVARDLTVTFTPSPSAANRVAIVCGIEVVAEGK
jgi:outer membrane protein assembly factor BamB